MADPVTLAALTTAATMATTTVAAGTAIASADAEQKRAAANAQWAERRALEERAGAQRGEAEEHRKADLVQSRLGSVAAASGAGASDKTVMDLFQGIEQEGEYNAQTVKATSDQRVAGIEYQSALDRWTADSNARIKRVGAVGTLLGGYSKAYGDGVAAYGKSRMAMKHGDGSSSGGYGRTGY